VRIFLSPARKRQIRYGIAARQQTYDNRHQLDQRRTIIPIRRPSDSCSTVQYLARVLVLVQVLLYCRRWSFLSWCFPFSACCYIFPFHCFAFHLQVPVCHCSFTRPSRNQVKPTPDLAPIGTRVSKNVAHKERLDGGLRKGSVLHGVMRSSSQTSAKRLMRHGP
jgi:hypothetical protein